MLPAKINRATVYCARNNETAVELDVEDLGCGAGRIKCPECGGDGNWGKFAPGMAPSEMKCPDCKGSGYQLVSI
jgi:DnaJ-class molecular chaperone